MALDAAPIILLAAAVAWVSLVTMEFYEKIYRPKIERNLDKLKTLGESQLKALMQEFESKLRSGQSDMSALEKKAAPVASLLNADEELVRDRQRIFILLFVSSIVSIASSYAPDFEILAPTITLTTLAYVVSGLVFLWGFWILKKIFWFDRQFLAISKAERESPAAAVAIFGEQQKKSKE
jgi:hypothetical protein